MWNSLMQISDKYSEKTDFKRLPAFEWRIIPDLGIPENTGIGYSSGKLPACSKISQVQCI